MPSGYNDSQSNAPYLSVVVILSHERDLPARAQAFLDRWITQSKQHGVSSELIIVELAPPAGREPLIKTLRWSTGTSTCQIRIIEVPAAYPMLAMNAGIRRARGQFILATNIDIVFSDELVQFLAARRLEKGRMYRIDRHNLAGEFPSGASLDQQLAYCRSHSIRLHAREGIFSLSPEGFRQNQPEDITSPGSCLTFGEGWFPPERYPSGETIRWLYNDAEIVARLPENGSILLLECEPGPGLVPLPQPLEVFDEHGAKVAEWTLTGRMTLALAVPGPATDGLRKFRLRVPGGGSPIVTEPRILNLAVFGCDWAKPNPPLSPMPSALTVARENRATLQRMLGAMRHYRSLASLPLHGPPTVWRAVVLLRRRGPDIFEAGLDFQLGPGWSYLEQVNGERFRWVSHDAQFAIRIPPRSSSLALLIEPGPGQGSRPFVLVVRHLHNRDAVIARATVQGLTYLEFAVPAPRDTITTLSLSTEKPGLPAGDDDRVLNFRVLAFGARKRTAPPSDLRVPLDWPTLTLDSRALTKDWAADLAPSQLQIREMGKPDFLHTNACADFVLMAREHWFDLRGYPEIHLPSRHLHPLFCYSAHHAGAREEVLRNPMRIYHVEPPAIASRPSQQEAPAGLTPIMPGDFAWLVAQMRTLHTPILFNMDEWGLAGLPLVETSPQQTPVPAVSEASR